MKAHHRTSRKIFAAFLTGRPKAIPALKRVFSLSAVVSLLTLSTMPAHAQTAMAPDSQKLSSPAVQNTQPGAESHDVPAPAAPPATQLGAPPVAPSPAAGSSSGAVDNTRYIIGADDNLQITVWREPSLSGVLPVRPDGMISLVLIGDMKAAGKTPTQLSGDIRQQLKKYIQDPSVTVAVTAVNSQRIFMVGEVGHVGPVSMSPGMTPLQAISAAGGPSPYANLKRIYILRGLGAKQQKIPFNYKQALKGDNRQDITLQPGDTIVVP